MNVARVCFGLSLLSLAMLGVHVALGALMGRGVLIPGTPYGSIVTASEFGHVVGPVSVLGFLGWGFLGLVFSLTGADRK